MALARVGIRRCLIRISALLGFNLNGAVHGAELRKVTINMVTYRALKHSISSQLKFKKVRLTNSVKRIPKKHSNTPSNFYIDISFQT